MSRFDKESSHVFVYGQFRSVEDRDQDVIFAEAHLKAKKGNEEDRMKQVAKLVEFKRQTQKYFPDTPIIIAGDFNDVPESDSIQGIMEEDFIDFYSLKNLDYVNDSSQEYGSKYREDIMQEEERKMNESRPAYPEFSTFKYRKKEGGFIQRTIDYMFVSKEEANRLEVTAWLDPPTDDQLDQEMANPCINYPSDHYAQAYEIEFKKKIK